MTWHWHSHRELFIQLFCMLLLVAGGSFGLGHVLGQRRGRLLALDECDWFLACIRRSFSVIFVRGLISGAVKRSKLNEFYQRQRRERNKRVAEQMSKR